MVKRNLFKDRVVVVLVVVDVVVVVVVAGGRRSGAGEVDVESYFDSEATFQTGFCEQYKTLVRRNLLRDRDRYLSRLHLGQLLFVAIFAGLVWFRTERTETTAEDRIGIVCAQHQWLYTER